MSTLKNKIDFVVIASATKANCNGDPLNGNRPRTTYDGYGEISDVCIKRKIRNRMQDMGHSIFVQSEDRCTDNFTSLSKRASETLKGIKDQAEYAKKACDTWLDIRSFGQVFAFKKAEDSGISVGVRGPVSIHMAESVSPVEIVSMQITKSVNGEESEKRGSDTMGMKHMVRYGLYTIKGSINTQLAEKTGFSEDDAEIIKECLRTLFENDASSARPEGSMEVLKVYWFVHDKDNGCKQHSTATVHRSVQVKLKEDVLCPKSPDDYIITVEPLEGLIPEVVEGV